MVDAATGLQTPHGGELVDLMLLPSEKVRHPLS